MELRHRACKDPVPDRLRASDVGAGSLDQGEPLLHGLDLHALGFCVTDHKASEYGKHSVLENGVLLRLPGLPKCR